jgi:hypothetical protein
MAKHLSKDHRLELVRPRSKELEDDTDQKVLIVDGKKEET